MGIISWIWDLKLAEFRKRKNIYYVPKDFHTNPKYRTFDELHPVNNNNSSGLSKSTKAILLGVNTAVSTTAKSVAPEHTLAIDLINSGVNETIKNL